MKSAIFVLMIFVTRGLYWFLRHILPTRDCVVFLSRQSDVPSVDFQLLQKELAKQAPNLKQKNYCRRMDGTSMRDLLWLIKPTLALLTARGCFVDGQCIPLSLYSQRKGFTAVQIWHALGALKKFGWQTVGTPDGHSLREAKRWRMHANYTFIPCAAEATKAIYCEAFKVRPSQILIIGMPRVDEILRIMHNKSVRGKIFAAHPSWERMKKILYIPTFRKGKPLNICRILEVLTPEMRQEYKLIVKVHPNDERPDAPGDVAFTGIPTHELFSVADVIVTDYSAAAIEAALAEKPLYFYVPDLAQYQDSIGLNIRFEDEMPGAVFNDFEELIEEIRSGKYDFKALTRFRQKYIATSDENNTQRIVREFVNRLKSQ